MNNSAGLDLRYSERIARHVVHRINRPTLLVRLHQHWRIYRLEYLKLCAIIVLWIAFVFVTTSP